MFAPSQRISASSTNSIRKLSSTSLSLTARPGSPAASGDVSTSLPSSNSTARLVGEGLGSERAWTGRALLESLVIGMRSHRREKDK